MAVRLTQISAAHFPPDRFNRLSGRKRWPDATVGARAACLSFPDASVEVHGGTGVPHIYSIIHQAAFPPDTVKMMGDAFDQAWESLEPQYRGHPEVEMELARLALAKAVILFARSLSSVLWFQS